MIKARLRGLWRVLPAGVFAALAMGKVRAGFSPSYSVVEWVFWGMAALEGTLALTIWWMSRFTVASILCVFAVGSCLAIVLIPGDCGCTAGLVEDTKRAAAIIAAVFSVGAWVIFSLPDQAIGGDQGATSERVEI